MERFEICLVTFGFNVVIVIRNIFYYKPYSIVKVYSCLTNYVCGNGQLRLIFSAKNCKIWFKDMAFLAVNCILWNFCTLYQSSV